MVAADSGDSDLIKELMRTLDKSSNGQSVPDCLEGKVTHATILDKFRECYKDLYNSAGLVLRGKWRISKRHCKD